MNTAKLAAQALKYLESLNQPLPDESDTEFYSENRRQYDALYTLNKQGLGATVEELQELAKFELVRITEETKATVDFEVVDENGKLIRKDFADSWFFWKEVAAGKFVKLGVKTTAAKLKKQLASEYKYNNRTDPFWYKQDNLTGIIESIEWHFKYHLISKKGYESLLNWHSNKSSACTLGS